MATAVYVHNHVVTSSIGLFERWYKKTPVVSHFKVFGCIRYEHTIVSSHLGIAAQFASFA